MVKNIIQSIKSVLFKDPLFLFEEEKAFINEPFYFKGTNGKGVILVHGWSSTAYEVRRLGEYLNEKGYTVCGPMLKGHGTDPEDLENVRWKEWLDDLEKAYADMEKEVGQIYVAGTSIGANLAMILATRRPQIKGLVLMAAPYKIKFEKILELWAKFLILIGKRYNKKYYPPTFGAATTITRLISYQKYSVKSSMEVLNLIREARKNMARIKQPVYLIKSRQDHIISWNSLEKIYQGVGSAVKKKKYISKAYHTFISDIQNEYVFEDILNFLNEN